MGRNTSNPYTVASRLVDLTLNPGESKLESKWSIEASKKAAQARKRKRKLKKAEEAGHLEGAEGDTTPGSQVP